jgi:hypothetical protein
MKKLLLPLVSLFLLSKTKAQTACDLVSVTPIFDCVDTMKNIQYGVGRQDYNFPDPANGCAPPGSLYMDVFQPCETSATPRPMVIFIHGGGFSAGNKSDFWRSCRDFAERGYVAATISYRLSISILTLNRDALIRAGYRAMQDARCAVRYAKAHAQELNIDTTNIFLLGYSAGAVTALNLVYANDDSEKPAECGYLSGCGDWFGCPFCPDLGTLEGDGGWSNHTSGVRAAVSLAGAVMDLSILDANENIPVAMVHGTADETVAYDSACFLNLSPCPKLYGSHQIQQQAETLGLCTFLHTIPGGSHDITPHIDTITTGAAEFFKKIVCHGDPCAPNAVTGLSHSPSLQVYPNPAGNFTTVSLPGDDGGVLHIFDYFGRLQMQKFVSPGAQSFQLDLASLPPGICIVVFENSLNGSKTVVKLLRRG